MAVSPFIYEHPLAPEDVVDRGVEGARLLELAAAGRFVRLLAPRRYGKTSLLRKVLAQADRDGLPGVLVDFYGVLSVAEVAHRIERAYAAQLQGRLRAATERFLNTTGLGLSLGALGISATLQRSRAPDPLPALHALLELPVRTMARTGAIPIVVFDEFQDILPVDGVDALMRSHLQHHGGNVAYIFSGSEPGMMRGLFEDRSRPLYGQALPERLGRLADVDVAGYVHARFEATGKDAGEMVAPLFAVAQGHPQRTMLLAHHLWQATHSAATADERAWLEALAAAEAESREEFRARWRGLEVTDQRALGALTLAEGRPYAQAPLAQMNLKKSSATHAYERLVDRGELERDEDDGLRFVDPLFERWVRARGSTP